MAVTERPSAIEVYTFLVRSRQRAYCYLYIDCKFACKLHKTHQKLASHPEYCGVPTIKIALLLMERLLRNSCRALRTAAPWVRIVKDPARVETMEASSK